MKRTPLLAAAAAAVLLIGGGVYFAMPRAGQLAINVSDSKGGAVAHVDVFVDGKKWCDTSPCFQEVGVGLHQVKVSASGYDQPAVQVVAVGGERASTANFTLFASKGSEVAASSPAPNSVTPAAQPPTQDAPQSEPAVVASPASDSKKSASPARGSSAPAAVVAAARPAAGGGEGFLNINSIPPSTCFLDGKALGTTPRVHISVSAGSHVVKFVNADQGLTKTVTVSVGTGETKPAVARLE
jgi:serine/threonine-protein kinase